MFRVRDAIWLLPGESDGALAASSVYVPYYPAKTTNGGEDLCIKGLSVGYGLEILPMASTLFTTLPVEHR